MYKQTAQKQIAFGDW